MPAIHVPSDTKLMTPAATATAGIAPPGLIGSSASLNADGSKKKFDRYEFIPSSLTDGASETFRLCGSYSTGHCSAYWRYPFETTDPVTGEVKFGGYKYVAEYPGKAPADSARQVDWSNPARPQIEGSSTPPKKALVWIVYSQVRERLELAIFEQRSIKESIDEICASSEDFEWDHESGLAKWVFKIARKGSGLETSYSLLPKPSKVPAALSKEWADRHEFLTTDCLLRGQHPFLEDRSDFSTPTDAEAGGTFDADFEAIVSGAADKESF